MLYVLTDTAGALIAWATTLEGLPPAPPASVIVQRAEWAAVPPEHVWNPAVRNWVMPAPVPVDEMSNTEFRWRYTIVEQRAVRRAEWEHADPNVRADLANARETLEQTPRVRLSDPRTQGGVQLHASLGLLTPQRALEILTP